MAEKERCVLTLPLLTEPWQEHIIETRFRIIEHLQNSLIAFELRKLKNLQRTKAYREIVQLIEQTPKEKRAVLYRQRTKMLRDAGFSKYAFMNDMTPMQKHFVEHIYSQIGHKAALDVWYSFEKYLFGTGQKVHFKKSGTLDSVANKTAGKGMRYQDHELIWSGGQCKSQIRLHIKVGYPETKYEQEMLKKTCKYMRVTRKWVKDRFKYYLQLTLEGKPAAKEHPIGSGRVGIDIGPQSAAVVSENSVKLLELADRIERNHNRIIQLQRKMDRSKRMSNPDNFVSDGTIKRGVRLKWVFSKRYRRMAGQVRQLQRKNADIRKYQHECLANEILALGNEIYVETMNFSGLQRRAKETTINASGRFNRKKRFGKSLANKAPAMLISILDRKLTTLGFGGIRKVNTREYKASQYDHTNREYHKKELGQRIFTLSNGDTVQRDLYSAFLLMNSAESGLHPDQALCEQNYSGFKQLHDCELQRLMHLSKHHLSSFGLPYIHREPQANIVS